MSLLAHATSNDAAFNSDTQVFSGRSIENLQHAMTNDPSSIDWLVISHDAPDVHSRLAKAAGAESSGLLMMPQSQWDFQSGDLASLLDGSIVQGGLERLWLVGHSESCEDDSIDVSHQTGTKHRLIGAARSMLIKAGHARNHFASMVKSLHQHPAVQQGVADGNLRVHALFYLAHCGTFLLYNPATNEFRPLA